MYYQPRSLEEALLLLQRDGGTLLAGGTDLFNRFQGRLTQCSTIIDLSQVVDLQGISGQEGLSLGAMATHQQICQDKRITEHFPILAQAASAIGSPQIRSRGTIGGNLAHASPAADLPPALMVYEAQVEIHSGRGKEQSPVEDLFLGPGKTSLKGDDIITHIHLPPPEGESFTFFHKVGRRKALSISIINLALRFTLQDRVLQKIRLVIGSAAPTPLRITGVEAAGEGQLLTPACIEELSSLASQEVTPIDDLRASAIYRRLVVKELVKMYLSAVFRRC